MSVGPVMISCFYDTSLSRNANRQTDSRSLGYDPRINLPQHARNLLKMILDIALYLHRQSKSTRNKFPTILGEQNFWINLGFWETAHLPIP